MRAKRIFTILALSVLSAPVFANECIDNFDQHVYQNGGLGFRGCKLTDSDLLPIVAYINKHPGVHYDLALSDNLLGDQGLKALAQLQAPIDYLNIDNNRLTDSSMETLKGISIMLLDLSGNAVHTAGIKTLLENPTLRTLVIRDTAVDNDIVDIFKSTQLEFIDISSNELSSAAWKMIGANARQKFLSVEGKSLDDGFAESINKNPLMTSLILGKNKLTDNGYSLILQNQNLKIFALATSDFTPGTLDAITQSKSLERFYFMFSDAHFTGEMGRKIAGSTTLKMFMIFPDNDIDLDFIKEIARSKSINDLTIFASNMDAAKVEALAQDENLASLALTQAEVGNQGAIALSKMHNLKKLFLFGNEIADEGALAFIDNDNLEVLDLTYNKISADAVDKLKANSKIKELYLMDQFKTLFKSSNNNQILLNTLRKKI